MTAPALDTVLRKHLGVGAARSSRLSGGCVGDVHRVELEDGRTVVVKLGPPGSTLDIEARMLATLAEPGILPLPDVLAASDTLLVLSFIENDGKHSTPDNPHAGEHHAADLLATLHARTTSSRVGLGYDSLIGGLHQPNALSQFLADSDDTAISWPDFFATHRLAYMATDAACAGNLSAAAESRVHALCARIDDFIDEPRDLNTHTRRASLLHGDVWSGNVLYHRGRVAGLIDPAAYYGHPEIELAFITLFSTFSDAFFRRYEQCRRELGLPWTDPAGFFATRRHIYNVYPLLVHTRLFGGAYAAQTESLLARLGF